MLGLRNDWRGGHLVPVGLNKRRPDPVACRARRSVTGGPSAAKPTVSSKQRCRRWASLPLSHPQQVVREGPFHARTCLLDQDDHCKTMIILITLFIFVHFGPR